jgi:uncharacterized protein (TIGR00255 family)
MLRSMTGFGRAVVNHDGHTVTVEARTLNSKYTDINLRYPIQFRHREGELRNRIMQGLMRGKLDVSINLEGSLNKTQRINTGVVEAYFRELAPLRDQLGEKSDLLAHILRLPDVLEPDEPEANDAEWGSITTALEEAIAEVNRFREQEGAMLAADFRERVKLILEALKGVKEIDPERIERVRKRIADQVAEWLTSGQADKNRFEEELIYYLEKMDITEEQVRLENHCTYFLEVLDAPGFDKGKKLNFISQEMGREINTLGSKAQYAPMQRLVVQMKDELEKVKEQVLNIV